MPFVTVQGTKTYYQSVKGRAPALLLVHGAGGSSGVWSDQLAALKGAYQAFAVDLPGHWRFAGEPFASITQTASFIARLADALGLDKFILVGHSMGGAVSIEFALNYPERLKGLVLIGTGARLKVASQVLVSLEKGQFPFSDSQYLFGSAIPDDVIQQTWREMQEVNPQVFLTDFRACNMFDRVDVISKIHIPTQIIVGDEDVMTPVKYSRFLNEHIQGPQLTQISGAGHMCMLEKPSEINAAIIGFLQTFSE